MSQTYSTPPSSQTKLTVLYTDAAVCVYSLEAHILSTYSLLF